MITTDSRLFGTWALDSKKRPAKDRLGSDKMIIRPDGTLTFFSEGGVILLEYRLEGDTLVSDQPSAPREQRTRYAISPDGGLSLGEGPDGSRWVRISSEFPMAPQEAAARRRTAQTPDNARLVAVWGGTKLKEFRVPGLRAWYPDGWTQAYHDDGAPYFVGPREDSAILRLGILRIAEKPRRVFARKPAKKPPTPDEVLEVFVAGQPNSAIVELGRYRAAYERTVQGGFVHHQWWLPRRALVVVATYTESQSLGPSEAREELETVRRILLSLEFEQED